MWSKSTFALDFVVGFEDTYVDAWLYSDHQRYFFFQQISTVGALLQLVVQKCAFAEPLELLLNASCRVGLRPDFSGQTALSAALRSGKRQMLQHLLAAAREGRFTLIPGCTSYISDCFELMARRYPLDFLHFIAGVPLQPFPRMVWLLPCLWERAVVPCDGYGIVA